MKDDPTLLLLLLLLALPARGQTAVAEHWEQAACFLLGVSVPEDLDESALEHFDALRRHPLSLNRASAGRLRASGLLSSYQLAALTDYRSRSGALLSFAELAAVDGFGPETAEALRHFTVLDDGPPQRGRIRQGLILTLGGRMRQEKPGTPVLRTQSQALKYQLEQGRLHLLWSSRRNYNQDRYAPGTISAALETGRGRIVAGDYQLRFGQGLLLWSGFSMSGFPAAGAFCRNATGLSETGAWAPGYRGLAAELQRGAWTGTLALSLPGLRERMDGARDHPVRAQGVASFSRLSRNRETGLHFLQEEGCTALSADLRQGLGPFRLFGEAVYCQSTQAQVLAAIGGLSWQPAYRTLFTVLARAYPPSYPGSEAGAVRSSTRCSDENGFALGLHHRCLEATFDHARHPRKGYSQDRALLSLAPEIPLRTWTLNPVLRATLRRRDDGTQRGDLRFDLGLSRGVLSLDGRAHFSYTGEWGRLFLAELGCKDPDDSGTRYGLFLRGSIHSISSWDGRIYVYERDFPGSFNLPAYYGSGYALGACGHIGTPRRKSGTHTLRARISLLRHPGSERPTTAEARIQYQWKFP